MVVSDESSLYQLKLRGDFVAHKNWVTKVALVPNNPNLLMTASRDKKISLWRIDRSEGYINATVLQNLSGHNDTVTSLQVSRDGNYVFSSSWDRIIKLWDLNQCTVTRNFIRDQKEILDIALSNDNRQIISTSRDKKTILWNIRAEPKFRFEENNHTDWISAVKFSPDQNHPSFVTCGHDKLVKVWDLTTGKLKADAIGHNSQVLSLDISPDGTLCATGERNGNTILWDLHRLSSLETLKAKGSINAIMFNPHKYWLAAASGSSIMIWDLVKRKVIDESEITGCGGITTLAWSEDGLTLFAGAQNGCVSAWQLDSVRQE